MLGLFYWNGGRSHCCREKWLLISQIIGNSVSTESAGTGGANGVISTRFLRSAPESSALTQIKGLKEALEVKITTVLMKWLSPGAFFCSFLI